MRTMIPVGPLPDIFTCASGQTGTVFDLLSIDVETLQDGRRAGLPMPPIVPSSGSSAIRSSYGRDCRQGFHGR
jgi:hypothetical protein